MGGITQVGEMEFDSAVSYSSRERAKKKSKNKQNTISKPS